MPCRYPYPLGMEDGRIKHTQLSASSTYQDDYPQHARLNRQHGFIDPLSGLISHGGWCPEIDDTEKWLQVDIGAVMSVAGIIMQGSGMDMSPKQRVTKYEVQHSDDGNLWVFVMDITSQNALV